MPFTLTAQFLSSKVGIFVNVVGSLASLSDVQD